MSNPVSSTDAAAESIARSIASVVATSTSQKMTDECMRVMGARDQSELIVSLKGAVLAVMTKIPSAPCASQNVEVREAAVNSNVLAESILHGRRVSPRGPLDKLLDNMVDDMHSSSSQSHL